MKGLVAIPQVSDLERAYRKLQGSPEQVSAADLALWSQWTRFDPRLGEQWITHALTHWKAFNPFSLREENLAQPWPAVTGVLLEQAKVFSALEGAEWVAFECWCDGVMAGVEPASGSELFFIGLRAFAGKEMALDAALSLRPYLRWGYLGREVLLNKAAASPRVQTQTLVPRATRLRVLSELIRTHPRLTVAQYRDAVGGWVSVRQAQLDLKGCARLQSVGKNARSSAA